MKYYQRVGANYLGRNPEPKKEKLKGQMDWKKRDLKLGKMPEGEVARVKAGSEH